MTGGEQFSGEDWIAQDSTEVLEDMAGTWRLFTASLPSGRFGLRAASLDNNIFVFGDNILIYIDIEHLVLSFVVFNYIYISRRKRQ